jgi:hypothetical protein
MAHQKQLIETEFQAVDVKVEVNDVAFQCQFCNQSFTSRVEMFEHAWDVHPDSVSKFWIKLFQCLKCQKSFPDKDLVKQHQLINCKDSIKCHFCDLEFSAEQDMFKHARTTHTAQVSLAWKCCPNCVTYYPDTESLKEHQQSEEICERQHLKRKANESNKSEEIFERKHFKKWMTKDDKRLKKHKSGDCVAFQCMFCNQSFTSHVKMFEHASDVHPDSVSKFWIQCLKCQKSFPDKNLVKQHQLKNCKDSNCIKCHFCDLEFSAEQDMFKHARNTHILQVSLAWKCCPNCVTHYPDTESLKEHQQSEELFERQRFKKRKANESNKCNYCSLKFSTEENLFKHTILSLSWKSCLACAKHFPDDQRLKKHNSGDCEGNIDNKELIKKGTVNKELRKDGPGNVVRRGVHCHFRCNKIFTNPSQMYKHARDEHPEKVDKQWSKCMKCSEAYPDKILADQHQVINCKASCSDYNKCYYCRLEFSTEEDMFTHARMNHIGQVSLSWIVCRTCLKHFPDNKSLQKHKSEQCDRNVNIKEENIKLEPDDHVSDLCDRNVNNKEENIELEPDDHVSDCDITIKNEPIEHILS